MKKFSRNILLALILFVGIFNLGFLPVRVFADDPPPIPNVAAPTQPVPNIADPTQPDPNIVRPTGIFINPLKSGANTLPKLLALILSVLVQVGIALVTIAIIYAGFTYVSARGNAGQIEKAHKTILGVLIGSAIILGAYVIAEVIQGTVDELRQNVTIEKHLTLND